MNVVGAGKVEIDFCWDIVGPLTLSLHHFHHCISMGFLKINRYGQ